MEILSHIVLGLIVGFLARAIMPGEQKMGCWFASLAGALAPLFIVGLLRGKKG